VRASISASRHIVQVVLALCLISAIVIVGLVASSTLARPFGAMSPRVSVSQMTTSLTQGEGAIVRTLKPLCGSGSGEC
jgi:hypothetical protein